MLSTLRSREDRRRSERASARLTRKREEREVWQEL
jgi:hypothetical protein